MSTVNICLRKEFRNKRKSKKRKKKNIDLSQILIRVTHPKKLASRTKKK